MAKFDSKSFNPQAFGKYVDRVPNPKKKELAKSGAIGSNEQAREALSSQTGSLYCRVPYYGTISGKTSQNNTGATDIVSSNTTTFEQGFIVASRMDGWTERSFSKNITAGVDFMNNVAEQIADYKLDVDFDKKLSKQTTKNDDNETVTWAEYMQEEAIESIESTYTYYLAAKADNDGKDPEITADQKKELKETLDQYRESAHKYGYTLSGYLVKAMGKGVTESLFKQEATLPITIRMDSAMSQVKRNIQLKI